MECPSCQFNNMPGNTRCLRCGAALQLAATAIGIEPPRASARSKWLRRRFNGGRWWYGTRDAVSTGRRNLATALKPESVMGELELGLWVRMVAPGWAHWHLRYRLHGLLIALAYWPALMASVALIGTAWGATWLGIALAIHAGSIIDLLIAADQPRFERYVLVPAWSAMILAGFYLPICYLISTQILVRGLLESAGPLSRGDVIWFRRVSAGSPNVQPGDIVLYGLGNENLPLAGHRALQVRGDHIDRVIAGPGSRVRWHDGRFLVDDQPTPWQPLASVNLPQEWSVTVPPGSYCIVPSTLQLPTLPNLLAELGGRGTRLAVVPAERIIGRAWICSYPFAHWSRIK